MATGALAFGFQGALHIRKERMTMRGDACRVLYVSDIHLRGGRSAELCRQVIRAAHEAGADVVVLGGDLLDGAGELADVRELVRGLADMAPVFAVGGNHDCRVGMEAVREAVIAGGGQWIHGAAVRYVHGSRVLVFCGPEAEELLDGDVKILCAHDPRVWKTARCRGFDLVLAGHLHGCQVVAFEWRGRLFPGALFYPYCFIRHQYRSARLLVSRGVSDRFPIRWRCPREVILCYV